MKRKRPHKSYNPFLLNFASLGPPSNIFMVGEQLNLPTAIPFLSGQFLPGSDEDYRKLPSRTQFITGKARDAQLIIEQQPGDRGGRAVGVGEKGGEVTEETAGGTPMGLETYEPGHIEGGERYRVIYRQPEVEGKGKEKIDKVPSTPVAGTQAPIEAPGSEGFKSIQDLIDTFRAVLRTPGQEGYYKSVFENVIKEGGFNMRQRAAYRQAVRLNELGAELKLSPASIAATSPEKVGYFIQNATGWLQRRQKPAGLTGERVLEPEGEEEYPDLIYTPSPRPSPTPSPPPKRRESPQPPTPSPVTPEGYEADLSGVEYRKRSKAQIEEAEKVRKRGEEIKAALKEAKKKKEERFEFKKPPPRPKKVKKTTEGLLAERKEYSIAAQNFRKSLAEKRTELKSLKRAYDQRIRAIESYEAAGRKPPKDMESAAMDNYESIQELKALKKIHKASLARSEKKLKKIAGKLKKTGYKTPGPTLKKQDYVKRKHKRRKSQSGEAILKERGKRKK